MSSYNARAFSKDFSKRTQINLEYITKAVCRKENMENAENELLFTYDKVIKELNDSANRLHKMALKPQKQAALYKGSLNRAGSALQRAQEKFQSVVNNNFSSDEMCGQQLYEITQTLNSLMGIAVLPYEMHKDFLKGTVDKDEVQTTVGYRKLRDFISYLFGSLNCRSSYNDDYFEDTVSWRTVISFLRHVRNAACHSGDNALCILPLDNGTVIEEILFYDRNKDTGEKFAMKLSIEEVYKLVELIANFYSIPMIGEVDCSQSIKKAKENAEAFLYYGK